MGELPLIGYKARENETKRNKQRERLTTSRTNTKPSDDGEGLDGDDKVFREILSMKILIADCSILNFAAYLSLFRGLESI